MVIDMVVPKMNSVEEIDILREISKRKYEVAVAKAELFRVTQKIEHMGNSCTGESLSY